MQNEPPYAIDSVDNALRLLLLLQHRRRLRVSDAAAELGVARSTAHRLFAMLRYRGFAAQHPDKTYGPGLVFYELGLSERPSRDIRETARPHLEWLNRLLDETVHLMVLTGSQVTFLDSIEATQALRITTRAGVIMPAHRTSGGKALLAELAEEELVSTFPDGPPGDTPFAPDDMAGFRRALAGVRRRGYGVNVGESERGITAVGACVRSHDGRPVAALTVSAPSVRLPTRRVPQIARPLLEAARRMQVDLAK
ncbi:MAG: IclR family transcriptional regulator [Carbonactinosporaceae bacterium]